MKIGKVLCVALLIAFPVAAAISASSAGTDAPLLTHTQPSIPVDAGQELRVDLDRLKSTVAAQGQEIAAQKAVLQAYAEKKDGSNTAIFAALGVITAAAIAGFFAIRNQNRQAAQERLLKAVELIMQSRSGYQADIRRKNLAVFLDDETREHLKGIREEFSGPEFTDLNLALAQAMSEKASTPQEVLVIWKCVLKDKKFFERIEYLSSEHRTAT
jgi:hypothetical protein